MKRQSLQSLQMPDMPLFEEKLQKGLHFVFEHPRGSGQPTPRTRAFAAFPKLKEARSFARKHLHCDYSIASAKA